MLYTFLIKVDDKLENHENIVNLSYFYLFFFCI